MHAGSSNPDFWCHEWRERGACARVAGDAGSQLVNLIWTLYVKLLCDSVGALAEAKVVPRRRPCSRELR